VNPLTAVFARLAARLLPRGQIRRLQRKLAQGGFGGERHLAIFLATELVLAALMGMLGYLLVRQFGLSQRSPALILVVLGLLIVMGFYLPYMWLRRRVEARQRGLMRALPDALDLMAIGVSAGLSLDGAMLEVVQKWEGELSRELNLVLNEIRMGIGRRQALLNLAERTQLDDIRLLVAALVQADEIGANVSETLNVQAEQLRMRRRQMAEELARKAPVKMLIPLIFLIFPALFIVILAPAMLQVAQTLRLMSGSGG
jgi:tight adherence protein C